jgi:hypothetical protein
VKRSLKGGTDTVIYRAPYSDYSKTDTRVFPAVEFLVEVLQHLPHPRRRLLRTHGLYSSRTRGTPGPAGALARREGGPVRLTSSGSLPRGWTPWSWKRDHPPEPSLRIGPPEQRQRELSVSAKQSRAAWPR